ncbi:MAG: autotransporter-associated beta strand repeat-containing protein, partial [Cytophagales bacterium]|nr:autotransporter-associated beta strand repeat-containing protein [Cytophagales bacterium]
MKVYLLLLLFLCPFLSHAVTFTWNGAGADANMMNGANWVGGVAPSGNANEDLVFGGTVNTSPLNNFPNGTSFKSISLIGVFGSSSGFNISGNDIVLTGGNPAIQNSSGTAGVGGYGLNISNNITFSTAAPTISNSVTSNSSVSLSGLINNNGLTITVNNIGPNTNIFLHGNIIGTGGLTLNGPGLVWIGGTNSFTGGTLLNAGGIKINSNQAFGPVNSNITINGGVLDAVTTGRNLINYNWTANASFGFLGTRNLNLGAGTFTLTNNVTIDIQKAVLSIPAYASGNFAITQVSSVTPASATMVISGTNTFTGTYTVAQGLLRLGSGGALGGTGNGTNVISGATLDLNGQNYTSQEPLTISGFGVNGIGSIINSSATAATYAGLVTLSSASSILATTGDINLSNSGNLAGNYNLTVGGAANMNIQSSIQIGTASLFKTGNGTVTLAGNSNFTGATTVDVGRLHVTGSSINSTISINSGATLSGIGTVGAFVNNGVVQPGSPSTLGVLYGNSSSDFSGVGSPTLNVRIKGFAVPGTDYDRLSVSGPLTLGGSSVLNLDLSTLTTTGTVFGIVQMGSRTGNFTTVNVNNSGQYNVCVVYNATRIDVIV